AGRAEVILHALVFRRDGVRPFLDLHSTNRISVALLRFHTLSLNNEVTSSPPVLEHWVEMFEFDACIGRREAPVDARPLCIALVRPGAQLRLQAGLISDALLKHLAT